MSIQLNVSKIALGAFIYPWWYRVAFGRALVIPLVLWGTLMLTWHFVFSDISLLMNWALLFVYMALFAIFAVTCHRLVLLNPTKVASRIAFRWTQRETRFIVWLVLSGLILLCLSLPFFIIFFYGWKWMQGEPGGDWPSWVIFIAKIPALYVLARLCVVFPAVALDKEVSLEWAWRLTENNGWRLVVLVSVLPVVISQLLNLLLRDQATIIETSVLTFVGIALTAVEVAAISLAYQELTKGRE